MSSRDGSVRASSEAWARDDGGVRRCEGSTRAYKHDDRDDKRKVLVEGSGVSAFEPARPRQVVNRACIKREPPDVPASVPSGIRRCVPGVSSSPCGIPY